MAVFGGLRPRDLTTVAPPVAPPAPAQGLLASAMQKPGTWDVGGTGRNIVGYLADALAQMGGINPVFAQTQQANRDEGRLQRRDMLTELQLQAEMEEQRRPKTATIGKSFGVIDPNTGGFTPTYTAPEEDPAAVQIARIAGLTPGTSEWKAALTAAIPGYGYTQPVLQAKTDAQMAVADRRAANSASLKAQPTYAQRNPKASGGGRGRAPKLPAGFILD